MAKSITVRQLREELGLSQTALADLVGLANKASVSIIEKTGRASFDVALRFEELSGGRIDAGALNGAVRRARRASAAGRRAA